MERITKGSDLLKKTWGSSSIQQKYSHTKAPSTLIRFQTKTELFAPDTAIVHTTTPKTITENGAIRKRCPEWSDLKTTLFENAFF